MAKFLPFIVEKSTPENVYQTILSRSKGLNNLLVASILFLVLDKGITKVRKTASTYPDTLPLGKLYEELLTVYPGYSISNENFQIVHAIGKYIEEYAWDRIPDSLKEYELTDIMSFLLVMVYINKLSEYTSLSFKHLFDGKREEAVNDLVPHKLFSSECIPRLFSSSDDLAAYIHFHVLVFSEWEVRPVKAILKKVETPQAEATQGTETGDDDVTS